MRRAHLTLVHNRPARRRWWRWPRLRPQATLRVVLLGGLLGLVVLPRGGDLALAAVRPVADAVAGCRITSVTDGDTVRLWCPDGQGGPARLTGFDAPELTRPGCAAEYAAAQRAKWHLRALIRQAGEVTMRGEGVDRYGRWLVALTLDGQGVDAMMIEAGHARAYAGGRRGTWCGPEM